MGFLSIYVGKLGFSEYNLMLNMRLKHIILILTCSLLLTTCARTPTPITNDEISQSIVTDLEKLKVKDQFQNIDLYTAIALSIRNNRDLRVEVMQSALSQRQNNLMKFDMLPDMAVNAGYSQFTKYQPSTSVSTLNDTNPSQLESDEVTYTVSSEKWKNSRDIEFTWNALDFGLSYIRAGQQANRFLIAKELERKAVHNITREVVRSYWNAMAAENLLSKLIPLMERVDLALEDSVRIEELLLSSPMDALLYQKELLDIQRTLQTQERALINSKTELATLMGLLPNEKYTLSETENPLSVIDLNIGDMEEVALLSRPELMESRYLQRISKEDAKASMVSLLPGLKFNTSYAYNSNKYLMNQDSLEYGVTIGANLLNVFAAPATKKTSKANIAVVEEQHLAIAMTILSQVHLSSINYDLAIDEFDTAKLYFEIASRISKQVKNAQKISRFGELEVIREEASLLVAELRRDLAYTEMQHSIGQIYASIGKDILPDNFENLDLNSLTMNIEEGFLIWSKKYYAYVNKPVDIQNPILKIIDSPITTLLDENRFYISRDTFKINGPGKVRYKLTTENDGVLPNWMAFLSSDLAIAGDPPLDVENIKLKIQISNAVVSAEDYFTLKFINDELEFVKEAEEAKQELELIWFELNLVKEAEEAKKDLELIRLEQEFIEQAKLEELKRKKEAKEKALKEEAAEAIKELEALKLQKEAEEQARLEAEEQARLEAEEQARLEAEIAMLAEEMELKEGETFYSAAQKSDSENESVNEVPLIEESNDDKFLYIQIAAFEDFAKAKKVADAVNDAISNNVFIKETVSREPTFHRILVGPIDTNNVAYAISQIKDLGIKEYFKTIE